MSKLLTPQQLAERWNINVGTLKNWRIKGKGLPFLKMGEEKRSRIMYRESDVIEFERKNSREVV